MVRRMVILGLFLACFAACRNQPPQVNAETGLVSELPAPAYHRPDGWWRANHGALVDGPWELKPWAKPSFQWRECLLCHDFQGSCQACHRYLGMPGLDPPRLNPDLEM